MFTGIITEIGKIKSIQETASGKTFEIQAPNTIKDKREGASIAINGVCTTITGLTEDGFKCDLVPETLEITNLDALKIDAEVNLEPALTLSQALDGHLVQGHVDGVGIVKSLEVDGKATLKIEFPNILGEYFSHKGSITLNGVSLTISRLEEKTLEVSLIPHTLEQTNLKNLKEGDVINIEIDLIARYLKNLLDNREKESKYEFLKERGFI